jgi:hypothetical protein
MLRRAGCGICLHEVVELRPLTRDQEPGRGIIEAPALQLPDRGAQLEDLGAQFRIR